MVEAAIRSTGFCCSEQLNTARNPTRRFFSVSRPAGQIGRAESNDDFEFLTWAFEIEENRLMMLSKQKNTGVWIDLKCSFIVIAFHVPKSSFLSASYFDEVMIFLSEECRWCKLLGQYRLDFADDVHRTYIITTYKEINRKCCSGIMKMLFFFIMVGVTQKMLAVFCKSGWKILENFG